jgi:hypothetical protein
MRTRFVDLETTEIIVTTTSLSGSAGSSASLLRPARIPLVPLGIALSAFFAISYALCILLGIVSWDWPCTSPGCSSSRGSLGSPGRASSSA